MWADTQEDGLAVSAPVSAAPLTVAPERGGGHEGTRDSEVVVRWMNLCLEIRLDFHSPRHIPTHWPPERSVPWSPTLVPKEAFPGGGACVLGLECGQRTHFALGVFQSRVPPPPRL